MLAASKGPDGKPPPTHTTAFRSLMQRRGRAEEVASILVFLLEDQSSFVTGSIYPVDGGWDL